jgi:hypothetical protein
MERTTNTHHFLWERHAYAGKPYNALRQALKAEVQIVWHRELHADLDEPIKPSRPLAYNILNHLEEHHYSQPFDNIFTTVDYLQQVGNPETLMLADHLIAQLGYVAREA